MTEPAPRTASRIRKPRPRYPSDATPRDRSKRPVVSITLAAELLAEIDHARGDESRTAWIARAVTAALCRAR